MRVSSVVAVRRKDSVCHSVTNDLSCELTYNGRIRAELKDDLSMYQ